MKDLRSRVIEEELILESEAVTKPIPVEEVTDFSPLDGKTVGIFGDIQTYRSDENEFPCRILSCESLKILMRSGSFMRVTFLLS
ncbi:hypothetical protein H1D32_03575 [Anaerobacillus sp. CMMVII]|uniref:hypothetical protein n=1 Tax=Anaerobacillus sp. CMMVII TaxID=2755588 RepID=UPI0021B7D93F|nr:hypothetical protein [Anaerobacillus sp. CMMVII]MCT8136914.1 hypothetical protein [Anaerobacillus sp. CMMVII]